MDVQHFAFVPLMAWMHPVVELWNGYSLAALGLVFTLPVLIVLASRHWPSICETAVLLLVLLFAIQEKEPVLAALIVAAALVNALRSFERQKNAQCLRDVRKAVHDLNMTIDEFLTGLDRRTKSLDPLHPPRDYAADRAPRQPSEPFPV